MAKRIQIRRDTAANWTSSNPILAQGEFGYETNTKKFKIGDGITAWSSLSYFTSGGVAALVDLTDVDATNIAIGKTIQVGADGVTHEYVTPLTKLTATITIAVADWAGGTTCTKTVSGLLATDFVTPILDRANLALYVAADITGELQDGQIVFTAATTPTNEIVIPINIVR